MTELENRRPLKTRGAAWAGNLARLLTNAGVSPNAISIASVLFAAGSGIVLILTPQADSTLHRALLFISAALAIQLRLLCNLMDGMVAVEGGKGGPLGEIYNDLPDRLADGMTLACAGYAIGTPQGILAGWLCACGALITAYVRVLGTSLTGKTSFQGVMAKPQRMAVMSIACLLQAFIAGTAVLWVGLILVVLGTVITTIQRLRWISRQLMKGRD